MKTQTKRTAGNDTILANIKKTFNAKIYKEALRLYNAEGVEATRAYIGQWFNAEARERCLASIFGGPQD
jgi:hypothetical protein